MRREVALTASQMNVFRRVAKGGRVNQRALAADVGLSVATVNADLHRFQSLGLAGVRTRLGRYGGTWVWPKANVRGPSLRGWRETPVDASTVGSSLPPQRQAPNIDDEVGWTRCPPAHYEGPEPCPPTGCWDLAVA